MKELPNKYLTRKQALEKYPFLSPALLKTWLYNDVDGFRNKVVSKVGRRIFIDEEAFLLFLSNSK